MSTEPHEALRAPLSERIDYLTIIASMAGADVMLDPSEFAHLRTLCDALQIPASDAEKILETAHRPTHLVVRHLENLKASPLRFALLTDCLGLAYADGEYAKGEKKEIAALARQLDINDEQVAAIEGHVRAIHAGEHAHKASLAADLAAVGVPIGLVGGASAAGLAAAGLSGGAALVMGLGIASGLGAVLGVGVGTVLGVRWLHDKIAKE